MGGRLQNGKISALDSETVGGYAKIISTEYRTWEPYSFEDCVRPILHDIKNQNISSRIVMWNQGYDGRAIVKYLPKENIAELITDNETVYDGRYDITFIQGKVLKIRDLKLKATISGYDIAQFFNYMRLDDAGLKYVGQGKYESEITKEITTRAQQHTDNELYWIFAHNLDELRHYCMEDAKLTQKLGYYMANTIYEMYGFKLSSYASKTGIGKRLIKDTLGTVESNGERFVPYPMFYEESEAGKFAMASYHGGIFDCNKRGTFDEVTDIDISSAYPTHQRYLPNWSNGDFIRVREDEITEDDIHGWVLTAFNYPLVPQASDVYNIWTEIHEGEETEVKAKYNKKFYPTGDRAQVITLTEYRFLKKHGYLLDDRCEGYVWRHNPGKPQYPDPFTWIDRIYQMKKDAKEKYGKDSYQYSLVKIPLNSSYGVTAQTIGYAAYYNPFYASLITGNTRIQICEMLEKIGYDKVISIATDGILLEGNVTLDDKYTQGGLGSWDVEHWDKGALVLANGIYYLERDHENPQKRVKQAIRGLLTHVGGSLKADIIKHKNESEYVPTWKYRPVTMYQAMKWIRYRDRDWINRFVRTGRKLSCNTDKNKKWDEINIFNDLLENNYTGERFTVEEVEAGAGKE